MKLGFTEGMRAKVAPKEGPPAAKRNEVTPLHVAEINVAFKNVTRQVFNAHEKILESDNPALISLIDSDFKGKGFDDPAVKAKAQEIKENRKIDSDPASILNEDKFKNMSETTPEEAEAKVKAVQIEAERRKQLQELQRAFDIVHTVNACEKATSPNGIAEALIAKNKSLLHFEDGGEEQKKFREKYKSERPHVTDEQLDAVVEAEFINLQAKYASEIIQPNKEAQWKADYVAKYKDGEGNYHKIDPATGEPIADKTVRFEDAIEAITNEAHRLASENIEIKQSADLLDYSSKKKAFLVDTSGENAYKLDPNETQGDMMKRLDGLRQRAFDFCYRDEILHDDNHREKAINMIAQLIFVENVSAPLEVEELMLRSALGSFQKFREGLAPEPENKFDDWMEIQNEVNNIPKKDEKTTAVKNYLKDKVEKEDGKWNKDLDNLIDNGDLSEAMTAIFSSALSPLKDRKKVLHSSEALQKGHLDAFLGDTKNPDIGILNRAIFGSDEEQKAKRKAIEEKYGYIYDSVPPNKWKMAASQFGGMFMISMLGKFDELMSEGVEPIQQGQGR